MHVKTLLISFALLVGVCPVHALDISEYQIVNLDIPQPRRLSHLAGVETRRVWENILTFDGSAVRVPLSRNCSSMVAGCDRPYVTGLDRKSLRITWLDEGSLLQVSWATIPVGNGAYTYRGDVIITISDDFGIELYRKYFLSSGGSSVADWEVTESTIRYDPTANQVTVALGRTWSALRFDKAPLFRKVGSKDGRDLFVCRARIVERSRYLLVAGRMGFQGVDASIDLLDGEFDVEDVALFLLTHIFPCRSGKPRQGPVAPDELQQTVSVLRDTNDLRPHKKCRGALSFSTENLRYICTTDYDGAFGLAK